VSLPIKAFLQSVAYSRRQHTDFLLLTLATFFQVKWELDKAVCERSRLSLPSSARRWMLQLLQRWTPFGLIWTRASLLRLKSMLSGQLSLHLQLVSAAQQAAAVEDVSPQNISQPAKDLTGLSASFKANQAEQSASLFQIRQHFHL